MLVGSLGVAIEDHIVTWIQLALLSVRLRRFTSQIIELHKEKKKLWFNCLHSYRKWYQYNFWEMRREIDPDVWRIFEESWVSWIFGESNTLFPSLILQDLSSVQKILNSVLEKQTFWIFLKWKVSWLGLCISDTYYKHTTVDTYCPECCWCS